MTAMDTPKPAALSEEELVRVARALRKPEGWPVSHVMISRLITTIDARDATIAAKDAEIARINEERRRDKVIRDQFLAERDSLKAELATAKAQGAQEQREKAQADIEHEIDLDDREHYSTL